MKQILIGCAIFLACFSCRKEQPSPAIVWSNYYPLSIGTERIYECTQITIDVPVGVNETLVYNVRETVMESVNKGNTCEVFAENIEKQVPGSQTWEPYTSLSVQRYNQAIVRVEDNLPLQVLKFPMFNTSFSWNLNEFNTGEDQEIYYSAVNQPDTIAETSYDSVLFVLQKDFKSLFTYEYSEERYAKNVGLIYKKIIDVESQPIHMQVDLTKPIEERITKGTMKTYKLIQSTIK